jgi:hypothetical protein
MLELFHAYLYLSLVSEKAYQLWVDDTLSTVPGKNKSLFEVNKFLQWLRTAEEEDEDETTPKDKAAAEAAAPTTTTSSSTTTTSDAN